MKTEDLSLSFRVLEDTLGTTIQDLVAYDTDEAYAQSSVLTDLRIVVKKMRKTWEKK